MIFTSEESIPKNSIVALSITDYTIQLLETTEDILRHELSGDIIINLDNSVSPGDEYIHNVDLSGLGEKTINVIRESLKLHKQMKSGPDKSRFGKEINNLIKHTQLKGIK
jgi:hypothetical protein